MVSALCLRASESSLSRSTPSKVPSRVKFFSAVTESNVNSAVISWSVWRVKSLVLRSMPFVVSVSTFPFTEIPLLKTFLPEEGQDNNLVT